MSDFGKLWAAAAASLLVGGAASAAALVALSDVEPGKWELRERDGGAVETICLPQPMVLFNIRQPAASGCERHVVESTARSAIVNYSCAGVGQGRTAITVETGRLVQIDAQGVARGMPFSTEYEARRVGDCVRPRAVLAAGAVPVEPVG